MGNSVFRLKKLIKYTIMDKKMADDKDADNFISTLSESSKKIAAEELGEQTEKDRNEAVQALRTWVQEQAWLSSPTDTKFLLKFLRAKKFNQSEAREKIENFWKLREQRPEWFRDVDPAHPDMQCIFRKGHMFCPRRADKHNRKVLVTMNGAKGFDVHHLREVGLDTYFKASLILLEYVLWDERAQVDGLVYLSDWSGVTMGLLAALFSPARMKDHTLFFWKAMPARVKSIDVVNEPPFFNIIFNFIYPLIPSLIQTRFHVHGPSMDEVYSKLGYECLPDEMLPDQYTGPRAGTVEDIVEDMIADMCQSGFRDYIRDLSSGRYGVVKNA